MCELQTGQKMVVHPFLQIKIPMCTNEELSAS